MISKTAPSIGLMVFITASAATAAPPRYTIEPLPTLTPWPAQLGDGVVVLGQSSCPYIWADGVYYSPPAPCSSLTLPTIVGGNLAVGQRYVGGGVAVPVTFDSAVVTDLPTTSFPGGPPSGRVNDGVSASLLVGQAGGRPAQWIDGALSELPLPKGCEYGEAIAINASGVAVGWGNGLNTSFLVWTKGQVSTMEYPAPIDPPAQGYLYYRDSVKDVNDAGMILTHRRYIIMIDAGDEISEYHSFVYDGAAWSELPYFGLELTNGGLVAGNSADEGALVWEHGTATPLDSLHDGRQHATVFDSHADGRLLVRFTGGGLPESYAILNPGPVVPPTPKCRLDWDNNTVVNSTDVAFFINDWIENQATGQCADPPRYAIQTLPLDPALRLRQLGDGTAVFGTGLGTCPYIWSDGAFRYIPQPCGLVRLREMIPGNIAVGYREDDDAIHEYPAFFDGFTVTDLPYQSEGEVYDGTSAALVVGQSNHRAACWIDGVLHPLPSPEGCDYHSAVAVNASGVILGRAGSAGCPTDWFPLWIDGKLSPMASPAPISPPTSYLFFYDNPVDINDAGMILIERVYVLEIDGAYTLQENHSMLYDGVAWHELPDFGLRLANDGQLVGSWPAYFNPGSELFVWRRGEYLRLNSLIDNLTQNVEFIDSHADGRLLVRLTGNGLPDSHAILNPVTGICRVDWDADGVVNSTDVAAFINDWFDNQATGECP